MLIQVLTHFVLFDRQEDVSWARAFEPIGHAIGTGDGIHGKKWAQTMKS